MFMVFSDRRSDLKLHVFQSVLYVVSVIPLNDAMMHVFVELIINFINFNKLINFNILTASKYMLLTKSLLNEQKEHFDVYNKYVEHLVKLKYSTVMIPNSKQITMYMHRTFVF